jgi:hypothetical protein
MFRPGTYVIKIATIHTDSGSLLLQNLPKAMQKLGKAGSIREEGG